ncbi:universal stress protein [Microlunatus spumicola]|uniref:Universal stress protein n=1 Tax=Microlunatus spumicola TaxID=81499 RepID=A0ABP6WGG8_9ACTN
MGLGPAAQLVAVGVDGGEEAMPAARAAALLARERGWDLMLVHSLQDAPGVRAGAAAGRPSRPQESGEAVLDRVLAALPPDPTTRVHRVVSGASAVDALRAVSGYVSLLVLGQGDDGGGDQLVTGRVGSAVAAAARCPVLVVRRGTAPVDLGGRPVLVALDEETSPEASLRCAFDEAVHRGATVVVLHPPLDGDGGDDGDGDEDAGRRFADALAVVRRERPAVRVRTEEVDGEPDGRRTDGPLLASLVVVGRPHPGLHVASWSREVAGRVLAASACPLLVAPSDDPPAEVSGGGRRGARERRR